MSEAVFSLSMMVATSRSGSSRFSRFRASLLVFYGIVALASLRPSLRPEDVGGLLANSLDALGDGVAQQLRLAEHGLGVPVWASAE